MTLFFFKKQCWFFRFIIRTPQVLLDPHLYILSCCYILEHLIILIIKLLIILKFVTLSGYYWTTLQTLQHIEQKRDATIWKTNEGMGFLYPWTTMNVCRLQTFHFANLLHLCLWLSKLEKMPPHFWVETKLKKPRWFPYLIWIAGCQNWWCYIRGSWILN
jgi:hypothetical protein